VSATKHTVTIDAPSGMRIVADEWPGDGPGVVLAHGGGQTPALLGRHGRSLVVSRPPCGVDRPARPR
jgi:hypothetical protein